jgi:hypothetical protein
MSPSSKFAGVDFDIYSFPQKADRKPHRFPHYRTANAIGTCFLPPEQLFPKRPVLLDSNARSLSVSDAQEQVRALADRRLQVLTINC